MPSSGKLRTLNRKNKMIESMKPLKNPLKKVYININIEVSQQ